MENEKKKSMIKMFGMEVVFEESDPTWYKLVVFCVMVALIAIIVWLLKDAAIVAALVKKISSFRINLPFLNKGKGG
jgi:hypothetical protein